MAFQSVTASAFTDVTEPKQIASPISSEITRLLVIAQFLELYSALHSPVCHDKSAGKHVKRFACYRRLMQAEMDSRGCGRIHMRAKNSATYGADRARGR